MPQGDSGEKTEKPTPQRLKQSRKDGQNWRSPEVDSWLALLVGSMLLPHVAHTARTDATGVFAQLGTVARNPDANVAAHLLGQGLQDVVLAVLPLGLTAAAVAIAAGAGQGGVRFALKPLKPQASKLNPVKGLGRVFGKQGAFEMVKAVVKAGVMTLLVWSSISALAHTLVGQAASLPVALDRATATASGLAESCAAVGLLAGLADMAHRRRKLMKQLRMSISEVKREAKQTEGDPHLKGKIRSRQLAMSRNRMISAVADADVVIVNPVHVAVALKYQAGKGAPRVVASGRGAVAQKIREQAAATRVPVVVDIPLARTLVRLCDLNAEIPQELFGAVARVLAFVMGLKRKGSAAGFHTALAPSTGLPGPEVKKQRRVAKRRQLAADGGR